LLLYLQFAPLHKCFDTILISSASPACDFWLPPLIFHKYLEIIDYLLPIFPLFLLIYSMPLPVAKWNNIIFVRAMRGIIVGAYLARSGVYYGDWTEGWHGGMLLFLPGVGVG